MRILVTGAAGFVGESLVRRLAADGHSVRGLVRSSKAAELVDSAGAEPVMGDITDRESLAAAMHGVDRVFHIAALFRQAGFPASEFHRVNVEGTRNVLDLGIAAGVKPFIHCSTVGVHGHISNPPADENSPFNPGDTYQQTKLEGEQLFQRYVANGAINGTVVRPAMVYGPNDRRTLKLFKTIAERKFAYVGGGRSLVHFIDVRDLAEGFRTIGERQDLNGETFILAGREALRLRELVDIISALIGVPEPKIHLPVMPVKLAAGLCELLCLPFGIEPPLFRRRVDFFTKDRCFDCSKAASRLGFSPSQSLVAELIDIIGSYLESGDIDRGKISRPYAMVRSIDGRINFWDNTAHDIYGWSRAQAVGNISHSLLSTRFPVSIDQINAELRKKGWWNGPLVHRNKDGREIEVNSRWKLIGAGETLIRWSWN